MPDPTIDRFAAEQVIRTAAGGLQPEDQQALVYQSSLGMYNFAKPWTVVSVIDHGGLLGLADDDHTQYLLVAGTRGLSADWDAGAQQIRALQFYADGDDTTSGYQFGTTPIALYEVSGEARLTANLSLGANSLLFGTFGSEDVEIKRWAANQWGSVDAFGIGMAPDNPLHVYSGGNTAAKIEAGGSESIADLLLKNSVRTWAIRNRGAQDRLTIRDEGSNQNVFNIEGAATGVILTLTSARQAQFPATGSGAGVLIGGTCLWYASAANIFRTPDSVIIDGSLSVAGITLQSTRVTSSPYAVLASDDAIFVDTDGGAITVNLAAGADGKRYRIINTGTGGNDVTLAPNGAELLNGANASLTISDGENLEIMYELVEGWW